MKTTLIPLVLACGLCSVRVVQSQTYTFTTIAGLAGLAGSGDGTNSDARFNNPSGIAVDSGGALYVSDLLNNTVRKVVPMGTNWVVTTLAGLGGVPGSVDGTNSDARFYKPNGIAVDHQGNLFVADHYSHIIRKLAPIGTNWLVTTIAGLAGARGSGNGAGTNAQFWLPTGIAVDDKDQLYVVDTSNHTIRGIHLSDTNWVVSTLAGTALAYGFLDGINGSAEFDYPYGVAVNDVGTLFVTDGGNCAIRAIVPTGGNWVTGTIAGFSASPGTNDGTSAFAMFNFPNGIAVDGATNIFVADQSSHTIRKITPLGTDWVVSTIGGLPLQRGTNDGTGSVARFNKPFGIAVDGAGNLFVADQLNNTIRKGVPTMATAPSLQIVGFPNEVVLSWPAAASNFVLEKATSLYPGSSWVSVTNGITVSGDSRVLTNLIGVSTAFFRLHGQ